MSLRLRLVLLTVIVTFLSLLGLSVLVGVLLWSSEVRDIRVSIRAQANSLLSLARQSGGQAGQGGSVLPDTAGDLLDREGATAIGQVYKGGRVVWLGGEIGPDVLDPAALRDPTVRQLTRSGPYLVATRHDGTWTVQVGRSLRPVERTLERYGSVAAVSSLLLAAVTALITASLVGRALRPLERLAGRVQHLDVPQALPGLESADEVGDLARALDASLTALRVQRAREQRFLANASHELRTPVAALLADIQHTRSRERSVQEYQGSLARVERAGTRLQELTSNLLTLTRARSTSERRGTDLLTLAGDVVDRLQPLAILRGLDLDLRGGGTDGSGEVRAPVDAALITRLLENLVGNALKFTPEGEVLVSVLDGAQLHGERAACLVVEDSGPGIPAELLGDSTPLFEPFRRAGAPQEGFGLGLAVVMEVVQAHGGTVELGRRAGGGARVEVRLPKGRE